VRPEQETAEQILERIDPKRRKVRIVNGEEQEARPPAFSDEALALRFADLHASDLRYVAAWGKWLIWDGARWKFDDTLEAYSLVRKVCRIAAGQCNKLKIASALASAKTVAAAASLSRSDRRLAATVDQWDTDPLSLNAPGGVIDLLTGKLRAHRAADYMTKITAVASEQECPTPIWLAFLDRITDGDAELIAFLQRMAGYALTGTTKEHALFFLHGSGANGKTTFLNAITGIAGDYHTAAPIETFTASKQEHHPTDLAGLRGARLVTSVETEEGRRWAESKIKALTGGDKIAARFMRQDYFEFTPTFKLIIAGNHKPGLRSVDEAIRRRFHLVPFNVTIPPEQRDKSLGDRLRTEWPGILAWMIDGCLQWQERGLAPPEPSRAPPPLIWKPKTQWPLGSTKAEYATRTHGKLPRRSSPHGRHGPIAQVNIPGRSNASFRMLRYVASCLSAGSMRAAFAASVLASIFNPEDERKPEMNQKPDMKQMTRLAINSDWTSDINDTAHCAVSASAFHRR
jgi:putative DNA primase/helicase